MNCRVCGGAMDERVTDLPFKISDTSIVIVRALPVLQCRQCGETELENVAMTRVDRLLAAVDRSRSLKSFDTPPDPFWITPVKSAASNTRGSRASAHAAMTTRRMPASLRWCSGKPSTSRHSSMASHIPGRRGWQPRENPGAFTGSPCSVRGF